MAHNDKTSPGPVLGIETSCDETAAAIVAADGTIMSNLVFSQIDDHRPYGGVVPEIAARAHVEHLAGIIKGAIDEAGVSYSALGGIAATAGPGLVGGVMVGLMSGKAIASVHKKPFMAVNHLEAHALTVRMTQRIAFPYLLLLVSGGHCQLLVVNAVGNYTRLGTTIDDAIGEAFDKTAKMLGLGYPGGPAVEAMALKGDPTRFDLPRPLRGRPDCHFSFSGLKTALSRTIAFLEANLDAQTKADLCASFQAAVGDVIEDRTGRAIDLFLGDSTPGKKKGADGIPEKLAGSDQPPLPGRGYSDDGNLIPRLVVAGGVAANAYLRSRLDVLCQARGLRLVCPPPALCTDNGAMVAWAGIERLQLGLTDNLDFAARARWPLDPDAPVAIGAGVKA